LSQRIVDLVKRTLSFYKVLNKVLAININNVLNNKIFIISFLRYINFNTINRNTINVFNINNNALIEYMFYLIYVLQLAIKIFLKTIRTNLINKKLQKN